MDITSADVEILELVRVPFLNKTMWTVLNPVLPHLQVEYVKQKNLLNLEQRNNVIKLRFLISF